MLVEPDIERDAQLGVEWLSGDLGRQTLRSMGVTDEHNQPTTLEQERERVRDFIEGTDQLNWMIEYDGRVVGSVWVDLTNAEYVPVPSIHIMIGDPSVRGKGVGFASTRAVVDHLRAQGNKTIYSRHLAHNQPAAKLLGDLGFVPLDEAYSDADGLNWQNVRLEARDRP